jgi:hypothetical protein
MLVLKLSGIENYLPGRFIPFMFPTPLFAPTGTNIPTNGVLYGLT